MFETQGGTRNRTRNLPKKGSAFITSSDHWTRVLCVSACFGWCLVPVQHGPPATRAGMLCWRVLCSLAHGLMLWLSPLFDLSVVPSDGSLG